MIIGGVMIDDVRRKNLVKNFKITGIDGFYHAQLRGNIGFAAHAKKYSVSVMRRLLRLRQIETANRRWIEYQENLPVWIT